MKNQFYTFSFTLIVLIIFSGIFSNIISQNINNMEITSISLEHTNPSMGPYETKTIITLFSSEDHLDKIKSFLNNANVNNTISLAKYLEAYKAKDEKTIDKVLNNSPKGELNEGQTISNLTFNFDEGESITLKDVYRQYDLTHFNPEFSSYMVKHGSNTQQNPTKLNKEDDVVPPLITDKWIPPSVNYGDKTLIIHLALSPGSPCSSSYQLFVYGNGEYKYNGFSIHNNDNIPSKNINKASFTKKQIEKILNTAKEINFIALTESRIALSHVDDGQQTTFEVWQNGALRKGTFGYGESAMNNETRALANYILSLVEG